MPEPLDGRRRRVSDGAPIHSAATTRRARHACAEATSRSGAPRTDGEVLIIGSGFSGLGLATKLARERRRSFAILERAPSLGGTWRDNTYPGAACDIQSHLYSYSFRPNPEWSSLYASQPEILAYLERTAEEEGLRPHLHFDEEVLAAHFEEAEECWIVVTSKGWHRSKILVSAAGHLSDPRQPEIEGIEDFAGELFHSARWNHACELDGARVGVIGTGASAVQIVPEIAPLAGELTVFQRSAPWIIPRKEHRYSEAEKGMFRRLPQCAQALRDELFWWSENRFPQRRAVPLFLEQIATLARDHLEAQVPDPELRELLLPDYTIGCKRILLSNDYYPALARPNVTLEAAAIQAVEPGGLRLVDGRRVELEVLILATGFEASELPIAERIRGREGELLSSHWAGGGRAFACTTVHGFPNLFVMLGPNTGLGAGSIIYMVESQVAYISQAIDHLVSGDLLLEPTLEAEERYVAELYRRAEGTVWLSGGCRSWYLHAPTGRLTTLWPDFMSEFRAENGTFSTEGYAISERRGRAGAPAR